MLVNKIFNSLQGIWKFHRKLRCKVTNIPYGEVIGTAVFEKTDNHVLFYREEGILTSQTGKQLKIYREHFYEYSAKDDNIIKYFSENKLKLAFMYELQFSKTEKNITANGKHICNNDTYEASFTFHENELDKIRLIYDVTGPNKHYLSETSYKQEVSYT